MTRERTSARAGERESRPVEGESRSNYKSQVTIQPYNLIAPVASTEGDEVRDSATSAPHWLPTPHTPHPTPHTLHPAHHYSLVPSMV
ncbi:hypothetical protein [Chroococcidiopsis sp. SAG 2025]|uniref:hypothetical protein n=1 Tax=Chroococcidiopsis sp. SAG 2025 TaxID=171389 RepID=UPI0029370716|nr:hypothetical protein [Chroococcidiopsis sp. SAG 2025]